MPHIFYFYSKPHPYPSVPYSLPPSLPPQVRINHLETCKTCSGSGAKKGSPSRVCGKCQGNGVVVQVGREGGRKGGREGREGKKGTQPVSRVWEMPGERGGGSGREGGRAGAREGRKPSCIL